LQNNLSFRIMQLLLLIIIISPSGITLANDHDPENLQTVKLFFENDLFGDTDKYYTNAVQLTWLSGDLKQYKDDVRLPDWTKTIIKWIPFAGQDGSHHNVGLLFGQQIYTPADIRTKLLQEDDRPYAGFLYFGIALHSKTSTVLDTMELIFGMVGSNAFGEQAQNTIHRMRDFSTAKGWDNQLENEPGVMISKQRKWRLIKKKLFNSFEYDLISHSGLTLGNVRISANAGGEIRFGYRIPKDFGSDVIRAGAGVSAPVVDGYSQKKYKFGIHFFAATQGEVVMRDIFLDGNTWTSSPDVDRKPFVADLSVGVALNLNMFKLTYRHLFRTKQFYKQEQGQIIGSFTLTYSF